MRKAVSIFSRILLGILLLLTLAPFYLLVINSFKGQTEIIKTPFQLAVNWQFMNYAKALPQVCLLYTSRQAGFWISAMTQLSFGSRCREMVTFSSPSW